MTLDDLSLRTKNLAPLAIMAATVLGDGRLRRHAADRRQFDGE